jgi:hypothetical protein
MPPGAAAAAAMKASLKRDRLAAIDKGITSAAHRAGNQVRVRPFPVVHRFLPGHIQLRADVAGKLLV